MPGVSFLVLEGLERGTVFEDLPTPVSIGREEDNTIRLNDERVSRFHAKVQQDGERVILTDLLSTNGTRVNGHCIQMRVLQEGDLVSIGRCLLVFGTREQFQKRGTQLDTIQLASDEHLTKMADEAVRTGDSLPADDEGDSQLPPLFPDALPEVPNGLRPLHQAQVSDMLAYLHDRLRLVLQSAREKPQPPREFALDADDWNRLLSLEMDLAVYLRQIADPPGDG